MLSVGGAGFSRPSSMGLSGCQIGVIISEQGTKIDKVVDIANTLLARDFKGFGNQGMNGVIKFE